jgi:hypothetical protein
LAMESDVLQRARAWLEHVPLPDPDEYALVRDLVAEVERLMKRGGK